MGLTLAVWVVLVIAPTAFAQQPKNTETTPAPLVTNPRPVRTIPIPVETSDELTCAPGWTLVLVHGTRPMCANELRQPVSKSRQ
jgi:hypothetical protein